MNIYYSAWSLFLNKLFFADVTPFSCYQNSYGQICCIAAHLQTSNGFFCSVNHLSGGGVNANHNSPSLAHKNKTENDSRLLKNSEGNHDDEWTFCRGQEADIVLFLQETCKNKTSEKSLKKTSWLLPERGRSQATNVEKQKQTKWIEMHQSQVNTCFLRGPLRWLTEQKNPKFFLSLQNTQRNIYEFAYNECTFLTAVNIC